MQKKCGITILLLLVGLLLAGCTRRPARAPALLIVGVDGAEWSVVRELWARDRLPVLRSLAQAGSSAILRTAYGPSPVIWTTIATGLEPEEHGITDFVVATPRGDLPVGSSLRRAPALWNMLTTSQRRVAVLGWWATWPAESVNGVVVSDRFGIAREGVTWPPDLAARLEGSESAPAAADRPPQLGGNVEGRDRAMVAVARDLVRPGADYDLVLLYLRSVDVVSHGAWKYWRPERFAPIPAVELEAHREDVPRAYEDVDRALGAVLAAAGGSERVNTIVVSDHGFRAKVPEEVGFFLDFDRVLERLGFLVRGDAGVDVGASRALTAGSAHHDRVKRLRRGGRAGARLAGDLERALARVSFANGAPAFRLRDARPDERSRGADLVAVIESPAVPGSLRVDGTAWPQSGWSVWRVSGTHRPSTHGLLIAAGPDIAKGADLGRVSIRDLAPTFLYALGLPYGRDFAGRPKPELFTEEFRARTPLRAIDSWGRRVAGEASPSGEDQKLLDELRALGYLG